MASYADHTSLKVNFERLSLVFCLASSFYYNKKVEKTSELFTDSLVSSSSDVSSLICLRK
ncbi:hypothetical protein P7266_0594 [Lactococcus cremoris]|nr:hypothetical protein P7266_0594 [Lactococcus cremoris]